MPTKADKYLTPHFRVSEMRCRCRRAECDAKPMQRSFMQMLERLRVDWGKPLSPTSAMRCKHWNSKVGGAPASRHLEGDAADFWFESRDDANAFATLAEKHGFGGIGKGKHLVHVDAGSPGRRWTYQD